MKRHRKKDSKISKKIIFLLSPFIVIYLGITLFFTNHFYYNSSINGFNISGKTIDEANASISSQMENYTLKIYGRNNVFDEMEGVQINLSFDLGDKLIEFKKNQNPLLWFLGFFNKDNIMQAQVASYNEELFNNAFDKLNLFDKENIIEPKNASFIFKNNKYEIIEENYGSKIDKDILKEKLSNVIRKGESQINLEDEDCYYNPTYLKDSDIVIETKNKLNSMVDFEITYDIGENSEKIDGNIISQWINVDEKYNIEIDENKVKDYVYSLACDYNTFKDNREFLTSEGNLITVSGGNYGWIIDQQKETEEIIKNIKDKKSIKRELIYSQTAKNRNKDDIGNTYVEINLKKQHLWFYKEGSLIVEGDVVTGNASNNWSTPAGTYRLNYKERDAKLKGEDYLSDVNYWMPFNNNIGIHDAGWRNEFGGEIYLTNGSHGCVNAPYNVAEAIFKNIEAGTPIICYY